MFREQPADGEFLTSDQVIERLLSQPALRRRASTCVLPAVRVEGEWRFRRTDLESWIETQVGGETELVISH